MTTGAYGAKTLRHKSHEDFAECFQGSYPWVPPVRLTLRTRAAALSRSPEYRWQSKLIGSDQELASQRRWKPNPQSTQPPIQERLQSNEAQQPVRWTIGSSEVYKLRIQPVAEVMHGIREDGDAVYQYATKNPQNRKVQESKGEFQIIDVFVIVVVRQQASLKSEKLYILLIISLDHKQRTLRQLA